MKFIIIFLCILIGEYANAGKLTKQSREALRKYSIHFDSVVNNYYAGGFVGNGLLGAMVYKEKENILCWELGRSDVADHREGEDVLYARCRLPIGKLQLPMGNEKSDLLIDLEKAEVRGQFGQVKWRCYIPACQNVLIVEWEGEGELPEMGFVPALSQSPRTAFKGAMYKKPEGYQPNPTATLYREKEYFVCKQPMLAGGEYTTVWKLMNGKNKKRLILSIAYSQTETNTEKEAIREIKEVTDRSFATIEKEHRAWWEDFYSRSSVSVGEDQFDSFYWTQLYKLGSATRADRLPIDLMGPWYHNHTPWPAIWWNLNIQLTYSPMFTINHNELVLPLLNMLDRNVENLKKNVPLAWQADAAAIGRTSTYDCLGR